MKSRLDPIGRAAGQALAGLAFMAASMAPALAGNFTVTPVRIGLSVKQPNSVLQVTNHDPFPVTIQAEPVAWSSQGEQDVFKDNDDVLINPPQATIQPGATQFIRLGLRHPRQMPQEQTYRLFIAEVPTTTQTGRAGLNIKTLTRISLPIFVQPLDASALPVLEWHVRHLGTDAIRISVANHGPRHVQIKQMTVQATGSQGLSARNLSIYVLPGQARTWVVRDRRLAQGHHFSLSAKTDAQDVHETISADPS